MPPAADSAVVDRLYRDHIAHLEREVGRAIEEAGLDALVVHSGTPKSRTDFDDQFWPLRVTPHFQHWLPLAEPDCLLVLKPGQRPRLLWLKEGNFWEKPAPQADDFWRDAFEIVELDKPSALSGHLPTGQVAFVGEDHRRSKALGLEAAINPPGLVRALDRLRTRKTAYEVHCLAEANRLAAVGHERVAAAFRAGEHSELDLHLLYLGATRQDNPETPYKNIVALGEHAATLHHVSYGRSVPTPAPASLLLDAGATFRGYASDITRTYVRTRSEAAGTFGELLAGVEALQKRLCGEVTVGLPYERLHERAHEEVGALLSRVGVVRTGAEEAVASGLSRAFFPHGLGHSLGLQCHDVGCAEIKPKPENPFLRNTSIISEDQVFTIEPGIYFIDLLLDPLRGGPMASKIDWRLVDVLKPLGGIRIEDDLRVRAGGPPENLTRAHLPS